MNQLKHHLKIFAIIICICVIIAVIVVICQSKFGGKILVGIFLYCILHGVVWLIISDNSNDEWDI